MNFSKVSIEQMPDVARHILSLNLSTVLFKGDLGTGKTTLIKNMASLLHLEDEVSSPTFGYVNVYDNRVFHFDCYRINTLSEALDFGIEEYLDSENQIWIEWPEVIEDLIQKPYLCVEIKHVSDSHREILLNTVT